jgi:hypothetical protein
MNPYIEILLGCFLFAWLIRGVVHFGLGLLQIIGGVLGVVAVLLWTAVVAIVNLPMLIFPSRKRSWGAEGLSR